MSSTETSASPAPTLLVSEQHSETTAQQSRRISFEEVEKHVLVVDDDKLSRKTLSQMLQKLGFQVTTAKGGKEALQLLKVNQKEGAQQAPTHFQLLLVDVMMPEMDGFELLRIFKQAFTQDIPVIMISSTEDPDTITAAFNSGAEDFLQKPIRFEMLKRRVEMCLDDRARRRKETLYREMLKKEREKRNELTNRVKQQEKELEQIKSQISDTIETPMQVVMTTIGDLMNGNYSVEQYKGALVAILKSLGSRDLYRPKFSSMLEGEKLDTTTRKWLLSEFMQEQQDKLEKKKAATQPSTHISSLRRGSTKPADLISDLQQLNSRLTPTANSIKEESPGSSIPETKLAVSQLSPTTRNAVKDIDKFSFNVFDYSIENLIEAVVAMFEELDFINLFNIDKLKLKSYIEKLRTAYHDTNPYHNFIHAIDVTQFVYCTITCSEKISSLFTPLDCLVLLVASLSHDLEHPGLNNNYQVNAKTKLALLYNDTSVLENFHSARAFQLLNEKSLNFLENLTTEDYKEFRRTIINLILATDMANHFEILTKFQTRIQTGQLSKESKDDKQQFMNVILKCADISNAVRSFDTAHKWADLLIQEFCNQGDIEREQGLPISPLMDRNGLNKPRMQINFIDYIAGPLFKTMAEYVPEMKPLVEVMSHNRAVWTKFLEKEEAAAQQNTTTTTATSSSSASSSTSSSATPVTQAPPSEEPLYGDIAGSDIAKVKGFTVIIVDNDRRFHELASKLLKTIGYAEKVVTSSSETIIELEKGAYDLVLISYDLPGKEATDTVQQIHSSTSLKNIPIIGLCREENKTEATKQFAALNVSKCLAKPIEANKLVGAMEESIDLAIQNLDPVCMEQALELCGGEESFVVELLGDFIDNGVPQLKVIEESIAVEDYKTLQLNAHSMKGAAAQLAAKPLSQAAFSLEKAAKLKYPKAQCEKLLATLKQRFVTFQQFVHSLETK